MVESSIFIEVKEEFEEEIIDQEDELNQTNELIQTCCQLCTEGVELQNLIINHLHQAHHISDTTTSYQCCNCKEGIKLQTYFINHLLSHLPMLLNSTEEDEGNELESTEEIEHGTELDVSDVIINLNHSRKTKPSYHNQYNKRERSPITQKIQQEFTFSQETKLFFCNFCRNSYKHKQTVERHLSREHDERRKTGIGENGNFSLEAETKTFYCNICKNGYKHKQTIERHLLKEHGIVVEKKKLSRVQESNERKRDKNLECDLCGQKFIFRESLRKHLNRHLAPNNQGKSGKVIREKIVCDKCTKLVDPSLMKRHIQVHHSDFRPYVCNFDGCKTSFFDMTKFNDHKNIHSGKKPYICEFCGESFHYASNWRQHKLRHSHPEKFKCEVCLNCFVSAKSLRLHKRLHSEDPNSPKLFECTYEGCEKEFRYLDRLKLHISNVHLVGPELNCTVCSFVTNKKKYYKRHLLKVHQIKEGSSHPRNRVFPPRAQES